MATDLLSGAGYLIEGLRLIARPGLRRFVLVPLLINVLIFSAAAYSGVHLFGQLIARLESHLPGWLGWLDWILWPMFVLILLVVVFNGFALVANLIAAPFNGLLAEKVEHALLGRPVDEGGSLATLPATILPSLVEEVRKLAYALSLSVPFLVLLLIPVVGQALWFGCAAWVLAVQYCDYPMANHGLRFREVRQRLGRRRALSLGFGSCVALLSTVPVVNFLLMPSAVAGATAMWVRELRGASNYQRASESRVATRSVLLVIDHLSGRMRGEILTGSDRRQPLDVIPTEDLIELLQTCYRSDPESADALEAYLEHERGYKSAETRRQRPDRAPRPPAERMDPDEARAVLGLRPNAGAQEVRSAHRRLIQRLHPDRGGSDYLAARVNEAKQTLLD